MTTAPTHSDRLIAVRPELAQALDAGRPVMALESTIITHGMPWPRNLDTARQLERVAREQGVIPATIAVLDGRLRAGLDGDQLQRLARLGPKAVKCSRRDLTAVMLRHRAGGTTVAATLLVASRLGIRVFTTGGIGGVHRGAADSFDVSADLPELARSPVAVICSGPKAILDIGRTAEVLETLGVPVLGYQCDELPAFYTRHSGHPVDHRVDSPAEVAEFLRLHWSLGLGGVIIANPVPEDYALEPDAVEETVAAALRDAAQQGIAGKVLTPFLLARVERLTGGRSLEANVALALGNARLGARIAAALAGADV